ncbi:Major facilitator-type transporter psiT2 [Psilocybe cubensis]|uniref:Major facilitator superfamily (MFS) profile domain-containing protein n=2 Tax=Psilocybe cubensis TaxID=181762 RepID=A0A8H7Y3M9_PSICU|nr:Major facilitator-type transporter psiT2 [Psilocybe cubensis]KAH9481768.1 Major facilitator-type transporter psiT2 [Psilocybe cubensis]
MQLDANDERSLANDEASTADDDQYNEKPTPLPVLPLISLFLIQMAEPITAAVIYPFINQFVRETGITGGDEKKTGYYAGMIESAFFLAECLTVVQWGYLSDRYGRRPILLCAPVGLAFAMLVFGSSTTFWPLVLSRCMQGVFNGNIGVTKTSIAELTDASNRGDAYAYQPIVWSLGVTTAPIIGGMLSNPATRWPDSLGRIRYLRTHPYFLPCFVAALFAMGTFVFVYFGMIETLPSLVAKEKALKRLHDIDNTIECADATEESRLLGDRQSYGTESEASTSRLGDTTSPPTGVLEVIFTRPILLTLLNHAFLTLLEMSYSALLPLVYSTPIEFNGLGLDPFRIGSILATFGFCNSILQANMLGKLIRKYGARRLYRVSFSCILGCFTMYPVMHYFAQRAGRVNGFVAVCIALQLSFQTMIYMAYGSLQVLIVEAVPEGGPMGTVNGVAQMLGCAMRTIAPTFASSLFSISLQKKLAGGDMVYYVLIAITVVGIRCSALLPNKRARGRHRARP